MAQKTHAAELAPLRVHAIPFDQYKNAHQAEIHALVFCMTVTGPVTQVLVNAHFISYRD